MRIHRQLAAATAVLALTVGAAAAATAVTEADLNVRAGPGTNYPVVGAVPAGVAVEVFNCSGSWCGIAHDGDNGYVSRSYLGIDNVGYTRAPAAVVTEPAYEAYDDYEPDYAYGPGIGVGIYAAPTYRYRGGRSDWRGNWRGRDVNRGVRGDVNVGRGDWNRGNGAIAGGRANWVGRGGNAPTVDGGMRSGGNSGMRSAPMGGGGRAAFGGGGGGGGGRAAFSGGGGGGSRGGSGGSPMAGGGGGGGARGGGAPGR